MSTPIVIADFEIESSVLNIEVFQLQVHVVSTLHPYIQIGLEKEYYSEIRSDELYGSIRSYRPIKMLITPTDPILICLVYHADEIDYYTIDWRAYQLFRDYFVGFKKSTDSINWSKEGF